jgi:UDPglucose--hexose-1-phosphate uridylyltransferase
MSELRKDPILGRWVIVAANRADRPGALAWAPTLAPIESCPFCEGSEAQTPPESFAYREASSRPDGPGWRVRVVPNKFPALVQPERPGEPERHRRGMFDWIEGVGAHEVVIESPRHLRSTAELAETELAEVLAAYRHRLLHWKRDPRLLYGMIFKNVGAAAGASLEHSHSQLIVTPIVPITVWEEMTGSLEFYHDRGRCVFCAMIKEETAGAGRIVLETSHFIAFAPFAARFPFETWVLPRGHASHYENVQDGDLVELAAVMRQVIARLELVLDRPAYNYILHTAPFDTEELRHYHWHIEVIPSLTRVAGFEWGSGFYINPVAPEEAATLMREAR